MQEQFSPGNVSGIHATFFKHAVKDVAASAEQGRPVYVEKDYIKKVSLANPNDAPVREVREQDKREFPQEWANYTAGAGDKIVGTPLAEWSQISRTEAATLNECNVRSVEQLANAPDTFLDRLGDNFRNLRQKAKDFLAQSANAGHMEKLRADFEALKAQHSALMEQNQKLNAKLEELSKRK